MDKIIKQHFYLNYEEFEKLKKAAILCGFKIEIYDENEKVEYLKNEEIQKLIDQIVEFTKNKNEGFLSIEELEAVDEFVTKREKEASKNNTVVIDALNYGEGRDPKNWKLLEKVFGNLVFATRKQKGGKEKAQIDLYNNLPVLFCDKLSSDDMIVLYLAWKLGPECRVITNDFYKDHRRNLCKNVPEIGKIWDKWIIDAIYRHDSINCEMLALLKRISN
ncbi:unnamed protein product [Caenorhabditis angaria]|uniref:Uncharacterized protein n=1 Tax=Caenorhabditis angaria TaxID=860376 RepID=A0A9P1I5E8_9PELO|nr:unnamed protein product [Caenorhabditis angaria]